MKDFAKSIVCNTKADNSSHTKEEAKTKDEYFKILKFYQTQGYKTNAGEYNPNGRIKLHKGDDSVEIVLVGNKKVDNIKQDEKAKKLYDEMMDAKEIAEEWAKAIHSQPKDNLENGRKAAEEAYRKAKRAYEEYAMNSKTGNDTPEEYAKCPPKIVGGNKKCGNADYSRASDQDLKNWISMMEQDIRNYEKEAKKYEWYGKNEKGTYGASQYNHAIEEIDESKSNIKRMQEELRKRGVRNSLPEELEKDVEKKDKEKVEDIEELKKTGNKEVYVNQSEKTKAVLYDDGTIMLWDKNGNNFKTIKTSSLEDARKKLNSDFVKVGNASINELQSFLDQYGTGASLSQMVSMAARKFGDFSILNDRYLVDQKSGDTYQLIKSAAQGKYVAKKVGNDISGLGLKKGDTVKVKSGMWSGEKGKVTGIHVSAKDQTLEVEVKLDNGGYVVDDQKQFIKVGSSASDDKFAYVMREFEEGKLKTPDGKVVTDPAQAKAIAYSESKKTENGLTRARNAIKK